MQKKTKNIEEDVEDDRDINFYTLPSVQQFMNHHEDKQLRYTGIPITQHALLCGKTNSGKSLCLLNYIRRTSKPRNGTFTKIFMCAKKIEPFNRYLKEELKDLFHLVIGLDSFPSVQEFPDLSEDNDNYFLIIFDDCVNDTDRNSVKKINEYFTYGRAKGLQVLFLTQSFFQTNIFLRKQVSWVILNGISGNKDLTNILRDFEIGDVTKEEIVKMYRFAKEKENDRDPPPFLKICTYECPINKRFSKCWLNYLNPEDFR